jgi:molybdopterin molybdotransferase
MDSGRYGIAWKRPCHPNLEWNVINVNKAVELVSQHSAQSQQQNQSTEIIPLENLLGRVLSEDLVASREQPPFDRVAMDGIAISFTSLDQSRLFPIEGIQKAGRKQLTLSNSENCFEVMTGASLPIGVNTVIPYEQVEIKNNKATLSEELIVKNKSHIHFKGSDYKTNDMLLQKGQIITTPMIALIASLGLTEVQVTKNPKIAVISTGDELIEPGKNCEPWQIWRSNPFGLQGQLNTMGIAKENISLFHILDDAKDLFNQLKMILDRHQIVILSGGVSMGKYDFVHTVMPDLNVSKIFHKIKQKPGKPMYFGKGEKDQSVFGLPGNPISALVCMQKYVIPAIQKMIGTTTKSSYAVLTEDILFNKDFTLFKPVKIEHCPDGKMMATPTSSNGSGDFLSLALSDGFVELPEDKIIYNKGEVFPYFSWSQLS